MTRPTDWTTSTTRVAGVQEQHRVQRGDVDAFGQAAGVGQDAALALGDRRLEPVRARALRSRALKVPSTWWTSQRRPRFVRRRRCRRSPVDRAVPVGVDDSGNSSATCLEVGDVLGERDRALHRRARPERSRCRRRCVRRVWPARSSSRRSWLRRRGAARRHRRRAAAASGAATSSSSTVSTRTL